MIITECQIEVNESLKERVFDVWLNGMLEELATIPVFPTPPYGNLPEPPQE